MPPLTPIEDPFNGPELEDVPLKFTPLVTVLCQARFPAPVSQLTEALGERSLIRGLAEMYPFAEPRQSFELTWQPNKGLAPRPSEEETWVLTDDEQVWELTIQNSSISLQAKEYSSRIEFLERLRRTLAAIESAVTLPTFSRVGLRYCNRLTDETLLENLEHLIAPGAYGILPVVSLGELQHAMSDVLYRWPGTSMGLQARWGVMPPNATLDTTMQPINAQSWVLDIDSYSEAKIAASSDSVGELASRLSANAYRFFRWVMTDEALDRFGAER